MLGWGDNVFHKLCCASIFFCDGYCCLTNGNKLHGAGAWMAGSWGVSNSVLKDDEARASGFCGRLRPDWSQHKVLVEEKEKRRTGFRQAAVKLGELTMAALFLAGDMGWGRWGDWSDSPETALSLSKVTTNWISDKFPRPDMTLCGAKKNKQQMARFLRYMWWHWMHCVRKWLFILLKIGSQFGICWCQFF